MRPLMFSIAVFACSALMAAPPKDLAEYVFKEDKSFAWKLKEKTENNGTAVYLLSLTSQTWQDNVWTHDLQIFVPKNAKPQATMLLWNQGGTASPTNAILGLTIAEKVGAPVAFLYGIPMQPLYDGKKEDALIAHTFVKFLETKDASWPLLFPMAKSIVRTMDAIQAFAKDEWKHEQAMFVISGASKRGWTSWLTAASGDKRVKAIAPMVIDTLNFPAQMKNQVAAFGKPSDMIADYTRANLVPIPETDDAKRLWQMVDPYIYRESLTLPKMLIHGTNDPYWPQDALNSYWDDLKGDKYIAYSPNAGHDLREVGTDGKKIAFPMRAVDTLSAFARCQIFDKKMPALEWTVDGDSINLKPGDEPKSLRVWTATSDTRDFRKSRWTSQDLKASAAKSGENVPAVVSAKGFAATFVEAEFTTDAGSMNLTTQIVVREAKK